MPGHVQRVCVGRFFVRSLYFEGMIVRYLSVCSGIEAASVAWEPLGWQPVGFSEIEPFPCSVLKHRFPGVPNYGDMTRFREWDIEPGTVDVLVGGTPCTDLSQGGLQAGWEAIRSGLAYVFGDMCRKLQPRWVVWENVPNALQGKHKAGFIRFVRQLDEVGYCVSWRVLNARYFRTAQQRRRVFVVASLGSERSRQVLLESNGTVGVDSAIDPPTVSVCLTARGAGSLDDRETYVADGRGVRHLTPLEHERLMGFPDNWTLVPHRGKPACDQPRYRAIGNSKPIRVVRWIGERIHKAEGS